MCRAYPPGPCGQTVYQVYPRKDLGTVLQHWNRLDDGMKKTLLETALAKTEVLVRNLEDDLRPLRISHADTGTEGRRI